MFGENKGKGAPRETANLARFVVSCYLTMTTCILQRPIVKQSLLYRCCRRQGSQGKRRRSTKFCRRRIILSCLLEGGYQHIKRYRARLVFLASWRRSSGLRAKNENQNRMTWSLAAHHGAHYCQQLKPSLVLLLHHLDWNEVGLSS